MEHSETRQKIINLGKLFVQELGKEAAADTLSRWMAQYLAEKMHQLEQAAGEEKKVLEKECFDVILKLWEHRWELAPDQRPLKNFMPIFSALEAMNPDRERFFYNTFNETELEGRIENEPNKVGVKKWVEVAKGVDKIARVLVEYAIGQAASEAMDETTKAWIYNGNRLDDFEDFRLIRSFYQNKEIFIDGEDEKVVISRREEQKKRAKVEMYRSRIGMLQQFKELYEYVLKAFAADLKKELE